MREDRHGPYVLGERVVVIAGGSAAGTEEIEKQAAGTTLKRICEPEGGALAIQGPATICEP